MFCWSSYLHLNSIDIYKSVEVLNYFSLFIYVETYSPDYRLQFLLLWLEIRKKKKKNHVNGIKSYFFLLVAYSF